MSLLGNAKKIMKKSIADQQRKSKKLVEELNELHKNTILTETQKIKITAARYEFQQKRKEMFQRQTNELKELGEDYIQKEIDIIKDIKLKLVY